MPLLSGWLLHHGCIWCSGDLSIRVKHVSDAVVSTLGSCETRLAAAGSRLQAQQARGPVPLPTDPIPSKRRSSFLPCFTMVMVSVLAAPGPVVAGIGLFDKTTRPEALSFAYSQCTFRPSMEAFDPSTSLRFSNPGLRGHPCKCDEALTHCFSLLCSLQPPGLFLEQFLAVQREKMVQDEVERQERHKRRAAAREVCVLVNVPLQDYAFFRYSPLRCPETKGATSCGR